MCGDDQGLLLVLPHDLFSRIDRYMMQFRIIARTARHAQFDPAPDRLKVVTVRFQSLAAAVRYFPSRLLQQQTSFGRSRKDATTACFFSDRCIVKVGVEAK